MVIIVRVALSRTLLAAAALLASTVAAFAVGSVAASPAAAAATRSTRLASRAPSRAQIAQAVRRAESSASLWATINICNSSAYPDSLGVRGQMPALGFSSVLSMVIRTEYWSTAEKGFVPIPGSIATRSLTLGGATAGVEQAGAVFPFPAHAGLLSASVQFTWILGGKVLGQTLRAATSGHPGADYGSPPHFSAASCRIP